MKIFWILIGFLLLPFASAFAAGGCPVGQYQVRGHFRSGYVRSDGVLVRPTQVKTHCRQLSRAYQFTQSRFQKGIPKDWPHRQEKQGVWTDAQKERVIEALEALPDALIHETVKGIYRLRKSKDFPNPATSVDSIIVLYDSAFDSSRNLSRILAHELGHQGYIDLGEKTRQDYRRATGWHLEMEADRNIYWVGRKDGYVEADGNYTHEEDYANNLEYFLFDPDKLKKVTPAAYAWFVKQFCEGFRLKESKK